MREIKQSLFFSIIGFIIICVCGVKEFWLGKIIYYNTLMSEIGGMIVNKHILLNSNNKDVNYYICFLGSFFFFVGLGDLFTDNDNICLALNHTM